MLLLKLLWKLKSVCMRRHIGHLSLYGAKNIRAWEVLLWLNHAKIDILLVGSGNLLLLLLKSLDLRSKSKLFHCGHVCQQLFGQRLPEGREADSPYSLVASALTDSACALCGACGLQVRLQWGVPVDPCLTTERKIYSNCAAACPGPRG